MNDFDCALLDEHEIKAMIKQKGWTQRDIAKYWGISKTWVNELIKNRNGERGIRHDCAFRGLPDRNKK